MSFGVSQEDVGVQLANRYIEGRVYAVGVHGNYVMRQFSERCYGNIET